MRDYGCIVDRWVMRNADILYFSSIFVTFHNHILCFLITNFS